MVTLHPYQFFRLVRKPQTGVGRRYYRLLAYPQDTALLPGTEEARCMAEYYRYAAVLAPGNQWLVLNDKARQCIEWHQAGKEGYVDAF